MVAYFVRNQKDIVKKVGKYKIVIADHQKRYEEVQAGWRDGKYQITDRNLMIDGLMKQFIGQIDEVAVYNRVLTAQEATEHYLLGTGVAAPTAAFTFKRLAGK